MGKFKGPKNRKRDNNNNGNPYGGRPGKGGQPHRHPNNNKNSNKKEGCTLCGSTRHHRNQCHADEEEKQAYSSYKSGGEYGMCTHCNKGGSHLPSNCFKRSNSEPAGKGDYKNNKMSRNEFCDFCRENTGHRLADCPEERKWTERAKSSIEAAFDKLPHCIVCGSTTHHSSACNPALIEQRKNDFRNQAQAVLMDWIRSPPDATLSPRDVLFCGYCVKFCDHNTLTCTDSVNEYRAHKRDFPSKRFIKVSDADHSGNEAAPWRSVSTVWVDGKMKQKVNRPLVENKCPECHTVLPKAIKVEGQSGGFVVITCTNEKCKAINEIPIDNEDDGSIKKPSRKSKDALSEDDYFPSFARWTVTFLSDEQPFYEGDSIQTERARRHPHEYSQDGWWSFNDMGNFQPFFPPASCRLTFRDREVREEPNLPINHTRSGLFPFCFGCGQSGAIFDDDGDVVMTQSGPDMEGNLAGAGAGRIQFENPLYQLGRNHSPKEELYIPDGKCWCTIKKGLEPSIFWSKERR